MHEETLGRDNPGAGGSPCVHYDAEGDEYIVFGHEPASVLPGDVVRHTCRVFGMAPQEVLDIFVQKIRALQISEAMERLQEAFESLQRAIGAIERYCRHCLNFLKRHIKKLIPAPGCYTNKKTRYRPEYG